MHKKYTSKDCDREAGGRPVGYLQTVKELNSGPPRTNPYSGREEDLNQGLPDYKASALTTRPRSLNTH